MTNFSDTYKPPVTLQNGHLQTIYPALFRNVKLLKTYERKRITTPDNDFLDLDLIQNKNNKLAIISHGLEGDSYRPYMVGMVNALHQQDYDICAWNFRGCSGSINQTSIMYHSGATYDLRLVIDQLTDDYEEIYLIGFSLGGNLTLKYLGEQNVHAKIKKAVTFSVPIHLSSGADQLARKFNYLYTHRFLKSLKKKMKLKQAQFPEKYPIEKWADIKTIRDFDDVFTAPIHGFRNAEDYYQNCSSINFIDQITVPTLLITALNDPFLSKKCKNPEIGKSNKNFHLLLTKKGGHCGFPSSFSPIYWSEETTLQFFAQQS